MSISTAVSIFTLAMGAVYFAYWGGWNSGFKVGKQRGWVNGYASAKAVKRTAQDEVFDYEKN
jgi:hypothetical protein